jgi:hypothetical protein
VGRTGPWLFVVGLAGACSGGPSRPADRPDLGDPDVPKLLARVAAAQVAMPDGEVTDPRPAWPERAPDIVGLTVTGKDGARTATAFVRVAKNGRVVVPAGPAQTARELAELRVLDHGPWGGGLIHVVTAAGGAMPAWPDVLDSEETPLPGGGVRITLAVTQATIQHAVAGGAGPAPGPTTGAPHSGATPPPPMGTATLDIAADYAIEWQYNLGGRAIEGPSASPATGLPALSGEQLMTALEGARRRARAPRAMPALEPRLLESIPDIAEVPLIGLGPVYVDLRGAAGKSPAERLAVLNPGWASAAPRDLVAMLSAVDALPAGLVPDDLLPTASVAGGELVAEVAAPLVTWAAGGARQISPRVGGVVPPAALEHRVRIAVKLDRSLEWTLGTPR